MWRSFWREINTPSSFDDDPSGELANQAGHTFIGLVSTVFFVGIWANVTGEAPYRSWLFLSLLAFYALVIEWAIQKWKRRDSRFDTLMFAMGPAAVVTTMVAGDVSDGVMHLQYAYNVAMVWPVIWVAVMAIRLKPRIDAKLRQGGHK